MKKIYLFLIMATVLFASGCKQDEAVVPAYLQNAKLLGKWYLKSIEVTTTTGTDAPVVADPITGFLDQNYFIFKEGNEATFSSTIYGKLYEGYYSSNSASSPQTLKFKSGDLLLNYKLESLGTAEFVVSEITSSSYLGETTVTYTTYTYSR